MIQDNSLNTQITKIITERRKELIRNTSIPENLWTEALKYTTWVKNRSPTKAYKFKKTPYEALEQRKPNLEKERIQGSRAYITIPHKVRKGQGKLHSARAQLGYFVGLENESIQRFWDPSRKKIFRISNARIDDGEGLDDPQPYSSLDQRQPQPNVDLDNSDISNSEGTNNDSEKDTSESEDEQSDDGEHVNELYHYSSESVLGNANIPNRSNDEDVDQRDDTQHVETSRFFPRNHLVAIVKRKRGDVDDDLYEESLSNLRKDPLSLKRESLFIPEQLEPERNVSIRKEGDPSLIPQIEKCDYCMKKSRRCDGNRPCGTCVKDRRRCKEPTEDTKSLRAELAESKYKSGLKGNVASRVPDDRKCDYCMKRKYLCDGNRPYSTCIKDKKLCQEQTESTKSLIPEENRSLPQSRQIEPALTEKCDRCYKTKQNCITNSPNKKCRACIRDGRTCRPISPTAVPKETWGPIGGVPREERCNTCRKKYRMCDGETPCSNCLKHGEDCVPYEPRAGVPPEQKCFRCNNRQLKCDGQFPCATCTKLKKMCVPLKDKKSPKCAHCRLKRCD